MPTIPTKLTSRKFLLAVGAALAFYQQKQYWEAFGVVAVWLFAEAGVDIKGIQLPEDEEEEPRDPSLKDAVSSTTLSPSEDHYEQAQRSGRFGFQGR